MRISVKAWGALAVMIAALMAIPTVSGAGIAAPVGVGQTPNGALTGPNLNAIAAGTLPEFPDNITHFIFIDRENHAFDDYLGDCYSDINDTCNYGADYNSPTSGTSTTETSPSGDQLLTPDLHWLARNYSVFDNYYTSIDPYSAQAHAYIFTADTDTSGGTDSCGTTVEGTASGSQWADYNGSSERSGSCDWEPDSGQITASGGSVFDRFLGPNVNATGSGADGSAPPFLTIGDILWELNSPGCTHNSFSAIPGSLPGNSEAIDRVTCTGAGWWTNTTSGKSGTPPVINPTTHTPQMLDVCQYECNDISTYLDQWPAYDFISYLQDYGLPTYTFAELFDDHPGGNCGQSQSICIQWNDASMNLMVQAIMNNTSPYRNNTVIVVAEDETQDGQNGVDHINSGRRDPMVVIASPSVMKTGNPNPSSCGIPSYDLHCGNVVQQTVNTSNVLAVMERVEMNVNPGVFSTSLTKTTFPMEQNDQLAEGNPLEMLWKCGLPSVPCNTGVIGTQTLTSTTISPNPVNAAVNSTVPLTAVAKDQNGVTISSATFGWTSVLPAGASLSGTTGANVNLVAGGTAGTGHVCENASYSSSTIGVCAVVTISASVTLSSVSVVPSGTQNINTGGTMAFAATALASNGQNFNAQVGWTWTVVNPAAGSLNISSKPDVLFTAGGTNQTTQLCVNATYTPTTGPQVVKGACDPLIITTAPPTLTSATLSPATISVTTGSTTTFYGQGIDQYGGAEAGCTYTWTLNPTSLGSVSPASGTSNTTVFTAGTTAGSGTIKMVVTNGAQAVQSKTASITVGSVAQLVATATATPTSGTAPLAVSFTGTAAGGSGTGYIYSWTFGDGTSGTGATASHTYTTAGSYQATLTVQDSTGDTASASTSTISVSGAPGPLIAHASGTPTTGAAPLTVPFTGSASGGKSPYTFTWTFGDGSAAVSGTQSPSHTYTAVGTYTATLWVNDSAGATATSTVGVQVTHGSVGTGGLTVAATASPLAGAAPLPVSFDAAASGGSGSYSSFAWNFGDGGTGSGASTTHTFTTPGIFEVKVVVTDTSGNTATGFLNVSVLGVTITANPNSGTAPLSVTFTASATGGSGSGYTYAWTFGDSGVGTGATVTHTYTNVGSYFATVTVTDGAGHTAQVTTTIVASSGVSSSGFLGLSTLDWALVAALIIVIAVAGVAVASRSRHKARADSYETPQPYPEPGNMPPGQGGYPPYQPPQG